MLISVFMRVASAVIFPLFSSFVTLYGVESLVVMPLHLLLESHPVFSYLPALPFDISSSSFFGSPLYTSSGNSGIDSVYTSTELAIVLKDICYALGPFDFLANSVVCDQADAPVASYAIESNFRDRMCSCPCVPPYFEGTHRAY